jgi:hypothetical protein
MHNLRMYNSTLAYPPTPTPPPTVDPNDTDALIALFLYLFGLMCANNRYCSGTFTGIFAVCIEFLSMFVAYMPAKDLKDRFESEGQIATAKGAMFIAWTGSNVVGSMAFRAMYNDDIGDPETATASEKFIANSDAMFSHASVTMICVAFCACLYQLAREPLAKVCCKPRFV